MRKNIEKVIAAFIAGNAANEKTCMTDGTVLYSYAMPIAAKTGDGIFVVKDSAAPSATTRAQVRAVACAVPGAHRVEAIRVSGLDISVESNLASPVAS